MEAFVKEQPLHYSVSFWDGEPYNEAEKTGHPYIAVVNPRDERVRGVIHFGKNEPVEVYAGDAVIEHFVEEYDAKSDETVRKLSAISAMEPDKARATFHLADELTPALLLSDESEPEDA